MRFMAVVSHELRSPIHGICGLSETLALSEQDKQRQKKLKMIQNCSTRLLDLVSNIMDISSMRTNQLKLNRAPCDLKQIIEETVYMLEHATDKSGSPVKSPSVALVNDMERTDLPIIDADVQRITQVFYNLVMNALKFTQEGEVRLHGKFNPDARDIEIHVSDTGIGIDKAHFERVFEPFEREEASSARNTEGIGLGLAVSREIVQRHSGRIKVQSEVGKGTTFTVILPVMSKDFQSLKGGDTLLVAPKAKVKAAIENRQVADDEQNSAGRRRQTGKTGKTETVAPPKILPSKKPRVLNIDENPANHDMIRSALSGEGYDLASAKRGLDAVHMIQNSSEPFDAVLLDASTGPVNGQDFMKILREDINISPETLPVFMIANKSAFENLAKKIVGSTIADYVERPFINLDFRSRVRRIIITQQKYKQQRTMEKLKSALQVSVPLSLIDRALCGEHFIAQDIPMLTVLNCSIADWVDLGNVLQATQMAHLMSDLHTTFDTFAADEQLVHKFRLTDNGFLAVAGHDGHTFHAAAMLKLALNMVDAILNRHESSQQLIPRFVLHSGPGLAGVVGYVPWYNLCGDAVRLVQQLETQAPPFCISLSGPTIGQLGGQLITMLPTDARLLDRGHVQMDGFGCVPMQIVVPGGVPDPPVVQPPRPPVVVPQPLAQTQKSSTLAPPMCLHEASESPACRVSTKKPSNPLTQSQLAQLTALGRGSRHSFAPLNVAVPLDSGEWRVLSVDDDTVNQEIVQGIFRPMGLDPEIAMSGSECLQKMEVAPFNLILLDSMMPGMSGLEVCKKLRERYTPLELPIIMVTCRTAAEEAAEALEAGCNDYIRKPFTRVELVARVRAQLGAMQEHAHAILSNRSSSSESVPRSIEAPVAEAGKREELPRKPLQPPVAPAATPQPPRLPAPVEVENRWQQSPLTPVVSSRFSPSLRSGQAVPVAVMSTEASAKGVLDVLCRRSEHHHEELVQVCKALREQECLTRATRMELVACQAQLASTEADNEELWQRLGQLEQVALGSRRAMLELEDERHFSGA